MAEPDTALSKEDSVQRNMVEAGLLASTAGALLLNEPDESVVQNLLVAGYSPVQKSQIAQEFRDRLAIPQSGLYLPPYEHVFRQKRLEGKIWHFPPARYDGGRPVEMIYQAAGFRRDRIPANPLFRGANIPGDHLGYMLSFSGWLLRGLGEGHADPAVAAVLAVFIRDHILNWAGEFCKLLPLGQNSPYLNALSDAVSDTLAMLQAQLPHLKAHDHS